MEKVEVVRPCYKCEKREIGCHSNCEEYLRYQSLNEYAKKEKKKYYDSLYHFTTRVEPKKNKNIIRTRKMQNNE